MEDLMNIQQLDKTIRYLKEYHAQFGTTEIDYHDCYTPSEKRYHTMLSNLIEELEQSFFKTTFSVEGQAD